MNRLVLHIGWPKTGTSSIQAFCHANQRALRGGGVLYPTSWLQGVGHHLFPTALMHPHQKKGRRDLQHMEGVGIDQIAAKLNEEIDACSDVHTVIVSSERFMTLEHDQVSSIRDAFANFEIKVVFYLRRQDLFAQSIYAQNLRVLRSVPSQSILKHKILRYREQLAPWEQCFEREQMMLVPFERSQWQNGLELDFLTRLGLDADRNYTVRKPENERLSWAALAYLNEHLKPEFGGKRYRLAIKILDKYSRKYPGDERQDSPYSPQTRLELLESFKADNDYLSSTYNDGEPLFAEPLPDPDQPWQAFNGIEKADMRRMDLLFGRFF